LQRYPTYLLVLCGLLLWCDSLLADGAVQLQLEVLEDPLSEYTIEQVSRPPLTERFQSLPPGQSQLGFTRSVYWARFTLPPAPADAGPLLLELGYPALDRITLFSWQDGAYRARTAGDRVSFRQRELMHRNPVFVLRQAHAGQVYYARFQSEGSLPLNLRLWSPLAFAEYLDKSQLWFGGYYGFILVLSLTSLTAFAYLRSRLFFYYTLYIASYLMLQLVLNGFAFQYFWPEQTWWASYAVIVFAMLSLAFSLLFTGQFLGVWQQGGSVQWVFRLLILLAGSVILLGLAYGYSLGIRLAILLTIVALPCVAWAALIAIRRGFRPARLFLAAYSFFLVGALISELTYLGWLPIHFYTINAVQAGSLFEFFILMLIMAHSMRMLFNAKEDAQARASYFMNKLNGKLEQLVEERTHALAKSNRLLREQAMRDGLTGLLNHRVILERLDEELGAANRYQTSIAVIMLDLDHFKRLNDEFGHQVGDKALAGVAGLLRASMRKSDHCGRYGGEEFLVILSHVTRTQAQEWAERIRREIASIEPDGVPLAHFTCSLGVAVYLPSKAQQPSAAKLIKLADHLLYQAKQEGRNRVAIAVTQDGERHGLGLVERGAMDPVG